ncbi:MAG: DUF4071 domain-containing protein [Chloroflexaceae bacterium]|nr:DUF4071 domain-containing protein [Chloroflexaceae bacterium]
MNYRPQPIDTSRITLTPEQLALIERLAENTHDLWAQQRFADGWRYGPERSDRLKQHPGLVLYQDLPDSEKHYDRLISQEVLKALLGLGYRIEGQGIAIAAAADQQLSLALQGLEESAQLNLSSLLQLRRAAIKVMPRTPDVYRVLGDAILQLGEPLLAYDVIAEGVKHWPDDLRLQQLFALALARSGATERANLLCQQLLATGSSDEGTLSLLARTHKDLWQQSSILHEKQHHLKQAAQRYEQAYQSSGHYYPGINAATMNLLLGRRDLARLLAAAVREQCQEDLGSADYWVLATLGEVALIEQDWHGAANWYQQAAIAGQRRYGDLSSTRRNAALLLQYWNRDLACLKEWLPLPRIAVFSGHTIDRPDRPSPRFPADLEPQAYQAIYQRLHQLDVRIGYASAACGADILFLEALLELGGEVHVVLPYDQEQFRQNSVDIVPSGQWRQRFERLLAEATEVIVASPRQRQPCDALYEYANLLLYGLAKIRAEQLNCDLVPLALWNGESGGTGGTASAIAHWQQAGARVEIVDLKAILNASEPIPETPEPPSFPGEAKPIMALLFADVVNYSQLAEEQIACFVEHFLGAIAALEFSLPYRAAMKNTWGDALYYVFPRVAEAAKFALALCDLIEATDWQAKGLPQELNLRIALHAGPVYRYVNPITQQTSYIGTHVSHTARIEPIAPPGHVYASQAFAALAASEPDKTFTCDYVGQTPLAKGYGTFPTYRVRRTSR